MLDRLTLMESLWAVPTLDAMTWPDLGQDDDRLVELSESEIAFDPRQGIAWRQADHAWTTTVAAVWAAYAEEFDRLLDHVQVLAPIVRVLVDRPPVLSRPGVTFARRGRVSDRRGTASKRLRRLLSAAIRAHGPADERIVDLDHWLGVVDTTFEGVTRGEPVLLSRAFLPVLAEWLRGRDLASGTYHRMIRAEVGFPTQRFATGCADLESQLAEHTERLATAFRTDGLPGFRDAARVLLGLQARFPSAPGYVVLDLMFAERAPGAVDVVPALGLTVPPPSAGFPLTLADGSLIQLHRPPWTMSARMFGNVGRNGLPVGKTLSMAGELMTRAHQPPPVPVAVPNLGDGHEEPSDLDAALELVDALQSRGANLASLDLLSQYTDRSWTSTSDQLRWLNALIDVFRALSEDFTAAELCLRAIGLNDRISRATLGVLGQRDYTLIARAYEILVGFQTELERLEGTSQGRALSYVEAAKEATFSRALPGLRDDASSAEVAALVEELAHLEAEDERRLRTGLRAPRGASGRIVIRPGYEYEQDRQRRCAWIRDRLGRLRHGHGAALTRFTSCLDVTPDSLPDLWSAADWPPDTVALAYWLDRAEDELVSSLIGPDGFRRRHVVEVAPTSIDSLLEMAIQYPEDELDYIAERLTAIMLPPPIHEALAAAEARTLLVSGDASLPSVPWEALGPAGDQLGLRLQVCRSPSLLRTATQVAAAPEAEVIVDRALLVADPTGDLPAARREGTNVRELLAAHGTDVTVLTACSRAEFAHALPTFPLVHFAGHTNFLRNDPPSSHFVLADGPFTAADLVSTPLHSGGLFVLGSCESAQAGPKTAGGGGLGLATALLLNGAGSVVGTNWLAEDSESLATAEHLYPHLLRGKSVAAALHETRRELYRRGNPGWTSFTVMGHPFLRVS